MSKCVFLVCILALASGCVTVRKTGAGSENEQAYYYGIFPAPGEQVPDSFQWRAAPGSSHEQMYRDSEGCKVTAYASQSRRVDFDTIYKACLQSKGHEYVKVAGAK